MPETEDVEIEMQTIPGHEAMRVHPGQVVYFPIDRSRGYWLCGACEDLSLRGNPDFGSMVSNHASRDFCEVCDESNGSFMG